MGEFPLGTGETGCVDVVRCRAIVAGRVQGVFYRDSCRAKAHEVAVTGWVRNLADGRVEVAAEGDREAVDQFLAWCRIGPPRGNVVSVKITDEEPRGDQHFRIVSGSDSLGVAGTP